MGTKDLARRSRSREGGDTNHAGMGRGLVTGDSNKLQTFEVVTVGAFINFKLIIAKFSYILGN